MVFSSVLFMFIYLPAVLAIYYLTPKKWRNAVLFLVNLVFYGWGEPIYILIMLLSTVIDYTHGLLVEKYKNADRDRMARLFVLSSVVFNLGILAFFKYYDFIVLNLTALFPGLDFLRPLGIPLPIGISFYTFQTMSYTIDVYRGDAKAQRNIISFGTFVTLFPQLIAGPIIKYKDVDDQLMGRRETAAMFAQGVETFICGLGKKVLLANNIGPLWDSIRMASSQSVLGVWLGIAAFSLQLYFDFSGYSDMAIGLGRMLGFEFKINFNYPFIAKSITDFWRRWHMSLGSWFREYVYIPLGGNRVSLPRGAFNIMAVWALTGIWHGAAWNFLFWGIYFGVILILEKVILLKLLKKTPAIVQHCYTIVLVLISFALFAHDSGASAVAYVGKMLGLGGLPLWDTQLLYYLRNYGVLLIILIVASTPLAKTKFLALSPKIRVWLVPVLCLIGLIAGAAYIVDASYNPFLYFRF